ncbi:hypothetical protein ACFXRP_004711, partial [Salmonella enterica subsp. enterica serovar Braenderup]
MGTDFEKKLKERAA